LVLVQVSVAHSLWPINQCDFNAWQGRTVSIVREGAPYYTYTSISTAYVMASIDGTDEIRTWGSRSYTEQLFFGTHGVKLTGGWHCEDSMPIYPYSEIVGSLTIAGTGWAILDRILLASDTEIPNSPSNFQATPLSTTSITLTWTDNSDNEAGFSPICENLLNNSTFRTGDVGPEVTSTTVTNLDMATTYRCYVTAFNGKGESSPSNQASVYTPPPPHAPSNVEGLGYGYYPYYGSSSSISLRWTDNSDNETGFKAYCWSDWSGSPNPYDPYPPVTFPAGSTFGTITNLTYPNVGYWCYVTAFHSYGESSPSNWGIGGTHPLLDPALNAPTNLQAAPLSSSSISLAWNDNSSNETGFKIWCSGYKGGYWAFWHQHPAANETSTTVTNLDPNTACTCQMIALSSAGISGQSNAATATTRAATDPLLNAPSALQVTGRTTSSVSLSWTDNSNNETGFRVSYKPVSSPLWFIWSDLGAEVTSITVTGLQAGTAYEFFVNAFNDAGESTASNTAQGTTLAQNPSLPNAPSNLQVIKATASSVELSWTDNASNETGFRVYYGLPNKSASQWPDINKVDTTGVTITGLTAGTTYRFGVVAFNGSGQSSISNVVEATTKTPPAAPLYLRVKPVNTSSTSMELSWTDNSFDETGFKVFRSLNDIDYTQVATLGANVQIWYDSNLSGCTTYYYRVAAYNASGDSGYATGSHMTAPAAPTNLMASKSKILEGVKLNWDAVSCAAKYNIYECIDCGYQYSLMLDANGQPVDVTDPFVTLLGTVPDEYTFYQVSAIDSSGFEGSRSCTVAADAPYTGATSPTDTCRAAVGMAASPKPANIYATQGSLINQVEVTWNAVQMTWNYMGQGTDTYATVYKMWYSYGTESTYEAKNWTPVSDRILFSQSSAPVTRTFTEVTPNMPFHVKVLTAFVPDYGLPDYPAYATGIAAASTTTTNTQPGILTVQASGYDYDQIGLRWSTITGATYDIERATSRSGPWTRIASNFPIPNNIQYWYYVNLLPPNTIPGEPHPCGVYAHYYRVRAVINGQAGTWSDSAYGNCIESMP